MFTENGVYCGFAHTIVGAEELGLCCTDAECCGESAEVASRGGWQRAGLERGLKDAGTQCFRAEAVQMLCSKLAKKARVVVVAQCGFVDLGCGDRSREDGELQFPRNEPRFYYSSAKDHVA